MSGSDPSSRISTAVSEEEDKTNYFDSHHYETVGSKPESTNNGRGRDLREDFSSARATHSIESVSSGMNLKKLRSVLLFVFFIPSLSLLSIMLPWSSV